MNEKTEITMKLTLQEFEDLQQDLYDYRNIKLLASKIRSFPISKEEAERLLKEAYKVDIKIGD